MITLKWNLLQIPDNMKCISLLRVHLGCFDEYIYHNLVQVYSKIHKSHIIGCTIQSCHLFGETYQCTNQLWKYNSHNWPLTWVWSIFPDLQRFLFCFLVWFSFSFYWTVEYCLHFSLNSEYLLFFCRMPHQKWQFLDH